MSFIRSALVAAILGVVTSAVALAQTTTPTSSTSSKIDDVSKWTSDRPQELVVPGVVHDALNFVQDRRCLQMDIEAMESCKGRVGKGKRKMGRLPEAG